MKLTGGRDFIFYFVVMFWLNELNLITHLFIYFRRLLKEVVFAGTL